MGLISCPDCKTQVSGIARACPKCGRPMRAEVAPPPQRKWNPGVAAVLSLVIPGAGQMYKGDVGAGFAWLVAVIIGYVMFFVPGLLLHIVCVVTAAGGDPTK